MTNPIPQTGDAVVLWQDILNATWQGIVSDADTPALMEATMERIGPDAVITTNVLVGPKGEKGDNAPIVVLHWPAPANVGDLPQNWGTDKTNHGYWIGGTVYVWSGTNWYPAQPGPAGPPGPSPLITPTCSVIPMDQREGPDSNGNDIDSNVEVTNTSLLPHFHFNLAAPRGPQGPSTNIAGAPDYDSTHTADPGKILTVLPNGKWGPSDFAAKHPRLYTIPEQAFQSTPALGTIAQRTPILSYTVPAQDYDWVPFVMGHIKATGLELDDDPLIIGSEVRLGDVSSGTLIGRGFGNISSWATVIPHFSSTSDQTAAAQPDNGVGLVQAGHEATINMSLYNDGLGGYYIFNRKNAQLAILTVPQG